MVTFELDGGVPVPEDFECDPRRAEICEKVLQPGEELCWTEKDQRFGKQLVKKTLRRGQNSVTLMVQNLEDKVLTVGTYTIA